MSSMDQYYEILGLKPGVSQLEVKQAYRTLAKRWHPDRFTHDPQFQRQAQEKLKALNEAYRQLKNHQPEETPAPPQPTTATTSSAPRTTVTAKTTNAEFWYNRGAENAGAGRYKEALEDLSMAIRLNPNYMEAYRYRGLIHSVLGFELGAEADLNKAKTLEFEQQLRDRQPMEATSYRTAANCSQTLSTPRANSRSRGWWRFFQ